MESLTKLDCLLIRACKGQGNRRARIQKVFNIAYGMGKKYEDKPNLARYLMEVYSKIRPVITFDLLCDLDPNNFWHWNPDTKTDYWEKVIYYFTGKIQILSINELPDYISPRRFKGFPIA